MSNKTKTSYISASIDIKENDRIIDEKGPDHSKTFVAEVLANGKLLATGEGSSKKHAEMDAARKALGE